MINLIAIVLLSLAAPLPAAAQDAEPQQSQPPGAVAEAPAQPPPSAGPKVQRSSSGVIVIRSSSEATQAERRAAEEKAAAAKKAPPEGGALAPQAEPPAAKPPRARDVKSYSVASGGGWVPQTTRDSERRTDSTVENVHRLRNIHGRDVPYLSSTEKVVSEAPGRKTVERRTQRYDTEGRATRQQLIREQERTLADGTVERIATTYEQDLDGNMQAIERQITREKKVGDTTRTVMTAERTAPGGAFQPYLREESVETRQGEDAARIEKIVKRPDQSGELQEWAREQTVMSKSGNTSTTETQVWERSTLTGKVMLSKQKVGKLVERPDGSSSETVETYALSAEGSAIDVNAGGRPRLAQAVTRESKVKPNGEMVVTTATQSRSIADPSQMGPKELAQEVSRPTEGGEAVETTVYERDVNGRMLATEVTIEQIQK